MKILHLIATVLLFIVNAVLFAFVGHKLYGYFAPSTFPKLSIAHVYGLLTLIGFATQRPTLMEFMFSQQVQERPDYRKNNYAFSFLRMLLSLAFWGIGAFVHAYLL